MSSIQDALTYQLQSISQLLGQINDEVYCHKSHWLSEASIGQHTRHVIELVQCLVQGYDTGLVNYDDRKRDEQIESDAATAIAAINDVLPLIAKDDKPLIVEGSFDVETTTTIRIQTTYEREIAYNIEHAVHHMALIKVGLKELNFKNINENFGVAYATIQYRKLCAQ